MPSPPSEAGWAFSPVYSLLDSDCHDIDAPSLQEETQSSKLDTRVGIGLGNFNKLFETLGWPETAPPAPLPPLEESELSNSDEVPPLQVEQDSSQNTAAPVETHTAEPIFSSKTPRKKKCRKRGAAAKTGLEQDAKAQSSDDDQQSGEDKQPLPTKSTPLAESSGPTKTGHEVCPKNTVTSSVPTKAPDATQVSGTAIIPQRPSIDGRSKSDIPPVAPKSMIQHGKVPTTPKSNTVASGTSLASPNSSVVRHNQVHPPYSAVPLGHGLIPRTVRPIMLSQRSHPPIMENRPPVTPSLVLLRPQNFAQPTITIRSQVDRHFNLFNKLLSRFPNDQRWLVAPRQLVNESTSTEGIHIFFDASNILIGFMDMLRNNGIRPYDISFDSLALIMERRRPVAKRVFVGSHREANPLPQIKRLVETSKAVGYECNVQEQVYIVREESESKKFFKDVKRVGWHKANQMRSGSSSDSETGTAAPKTPSAPKWVEQGVDELLHLKMCQSIIDTEQPTTMVLATGDGAAAEMSDGFLAHVERAMRNGWKVELITWRQQTNSGYKRRAFRQKWGEQFTIIDLDDFLEDLIDTS